jgi:GTP-binding protein
LHVLLTKADKLKRGPAQSVVLTLRKELTQILGDKVSVQSFSSLKRVGVDALSARLDDWLSQGLDEHAEESEES